MFSQKLRNVDDDELRIEIDPCYEADPYELKLDEMFDAEPEPEIIEGLPASDALTPADRYLELFAHGGVGFEPYRAAFRELIPSAGMHYMETYNASEGFFAIADDASRDDMLLMLDYGTYYEFRDGDEVVPLEGVQAGRRYAMLISSCNGLWRYELGDVVEFTSTDPYRIRVAGRTRQFINAFGEEVVMENAERAVTVAAEATGAVVSEYTAGPRYMTLHGRGAHEWIVEFGRAPESFDAFVQKLDGELMRLNSDYEAKRFKDTTLLRPTVTFVPQGTFYAWMKRRGKIGGQNKVPRLSNDRTYIEQLLDQNGRSV